jgi:L-lactate dehydrogenase complex protein LldG
MPGREAKDGNWLRLPALTGWGVSKDFPAPVARTFHQRWEDLRSQAAPIYSPGTATSEPVAPDVKLEPAGIDKVQVFAAELIALGGTFTSCGEQEVAEKVIELLAAQQSDKVLAWEADRLPEGLLESLQRSGIEVVSPTIETKENSSKVKVGLTGAVAGIAETGTLLLTGGAGQPLSASLLPEVHIALLHEKDLYTHLTEVITRAELKESSAAILISGPSRTADIEMTLTIGVHGPGVLHVICITESV